MRIKLLSYVILGMKVFTLMPNQSQAQTFAAKSVISEDQVLISMNVDKNDDGVAGQIFLALEFGGQWQFFNGLKWLTVQPGQIPPAYYRGTLTKRTVKIANLNSKQFAGARLYIGYGSDFETMLNKVNYSLIFTVPQISTNNRSIRSVEFLPTPGPLTAQERASVYTRSSVAVSYTDGTVNTSRLNYVTLYNNTDMFNGVAAGASFNSNHEQLKAADGSYLISETPDGQSLMYIPGSPETQLGGNALYLITQFEYQFNNPGIETKLYGEIPGTMKLSTVDQNKTTGQLSVVALKNVDMNPIQGLWIPCAASLSPWNTHLGSEEYEPDARAFEEQPLAPFWTINKTNDPWAQSMLTWFSGDTSKIKPYNYGGIPEVTVKPEGTAEIVKHRVLGRISHELIQMMPDQRTAYQGDDGTYNVLTMFIADKAADLSAGTLYAAKWNQINSEQGGSATLTWTKLGHATDAELAPLANNLKFSDIFDTQPVIIKKDASGKIISYDPPPTGYTQIIAGHNSALVENLRLKPGMEKAAAFLETRRYAAYLGATTEFEKIEGVSVNTKDNKVYFALTRMSNGMEDRTYDPVNHIRIPKLLAGAVYEMPLAKTQQDTQGNTIASDYVGVSLHTLVMGQDMPKDAAGNVANPDKIANPDNLKYSEAMRTLFIGEDSSALHVNNFLWAYNIDTQRLTRILSLPAGAESSGLQAIDNLNGFAYIMSSYQHPGDFSENVNIDSGLKAQLEPLIDTTKASVGYIAGIPNLN